ncbi:hypothetical protein ACFE04_005504 [Oxalis oulophora]
MCSKILTKVLILLTETSHTKQVLANSYKYNSLSVTPHHTTASVICYLLILQLQSPKLQILEHFSNFMAPPTTTVCETGNAVPQLHVRLHEARRLSYSLTCKFGELR